MSQLVPCPNCGRHVRLYELNCPFCSRALDSVALGRQFAPRSVAVQAGLKRAAVFALGAGVAAACTQSQPVYGAAVAPDTDQTSGGAPAETSTWDSPGSGVPSDQPLYGAPITSVTSNPSAMTRSEETGHTSTDNRDAGGSQGDAGGPDAGLPDAGAGTSTVDASGGASDTGHVDAGDVGSSSTDNDFTLQLLYGAPVTDQL